MELNYRIQNYEWGKRGQNSLVATLHANVNPDFTIDEETPYAELWLGTHVNGPSTLKTGEELSTILQEHPEYLGDKVREEFGDELPFLFKVLSVNQALSIQAHPNKEHAKQLHEEKPAIYKDANHKPELAIALTPFEALCGFKPLRDIVYYLINIPELRDLVGNVLCRYGKENPDLVKEAVGTIFRARPSEVREQLRKLICRFQSLEDLSERQTQYADLILKLYSYYPDDVGCFMVYFLNYVKLQPFEALYLGPNEPHAYLYGDCIECMACSDNVVRAGLTPKYIDVETLLCMLDYTCDSPEAKLFKATEEDENCNIFQPPVPDFAVVQINVPAPSEKYETKPRSSASTLLTISGAAKSKNITLVPGTAVFLPANEILNITDITEDLLIYQGFCNAEFFF